MPKVDLTISIDGDADVVVKVATGIAVALSQLAPEVKRAAASREMAGGRHLPQRCPDCGNPDARGKSHARGCPEAPPVSRERLLELARQVEDGWIARRQ